MKHVLIDLMIDPACVERMRRLSDVTIHHLDTSHAPQSRPSDLLRQINVLMSKHPPKNFNDLTVLEYMQLATAGFDHLSHLRLSPRQFTVCNARGAFDTAIGEWCAAMMINLTRDLRGMIRRQDRGQWERAGVFQQEVRGKTVGLWGYGGIGRETARVSKALGMTVHVLSRSGVKPRRDDFIPPETGDPEGKLPDRVFLSEQRTEFLSSLDFLILAMPRTRTTTGLIGEADLRALPRTAFVLNPARGPIIQEQALIKALSESWIAGAALDTHYYYPMPAEHALWKFPNVIMTPHISGADKSSRYPALIGQLCLENLTRFQEGRTLLNVVSKEELVDSEIPDATPPMLGAPSRESPKSPAEVTLS
jgi:phosphoglycerate dehydrogenase-like enzyme